MDANGEWALFADWCAATDRDATDVSPLTLLDYARQVPCSPATLEKRLRAIVTRLGWAERFGLSEGPRGRGDTPAWRTGRMWVTLPEALARCEPTGWPVGFRGRRDAFLLVMVGPRAQGGLAMTRDEARLLKPSALLLDEAGAAQVASTDRVRVGVRVGSETVPVGVNEDAAMCPACAVVRWVDVASLAQRFGRSGAREQMRRSHTPWAHCCGVDGQAIRADEKWRELWFLAPAIDMHGWPTDWRPMSARAVTSVLSARCNRLIPLPEPVEPEEGVVEPYVRSRKHADLALDDLFAVLDEVADDADEVNKRIATILDDTDALISGIGKAAAGPGKTTSVDARRATG